MPGLNRYPKNIIDAKELTEYCVYRLKHKFKKLGFSVFKVDEIKNDFNTDELEKYILNADFDEIKKHCSLIYHYESGIVQYLSTVYS